MRKQFLLLALMAWASPAAAWAACEEDIERIDARVAEASVSDPQMARDLTFMRDLAVQMCAMGNESAAAASLQAIDLLLANPTPPSSPVSPTDQASASPQQTGSADPQAPDGPHPLGEPRDDLERFYGLFTNPAAPNRSFFVTAATTPAGAERQVPPGYLMIGPMWADVAPWYMKSLSETRFEQQWAYSGSSPVMVDFELSANGEVRAMTITGGFEDFGRLERSGDLPEGW